MFNEISISLLVPFRVSVTFSTVPTVIVVFAESIKNSFVFSGSTFFCFAIPKTSSNNFDFIFILWLISGRESFVEAKQPINESVLVRKGSSSVSIEMLAPGMISFRDSFPLCKDRIFVVNVWYVCWLFF